MKKLLALAVIAVDYSIKHPYEFSMIEWACGTQACLCGRMAWLDGFALTEEDVALWVEGQPGLAGLLKDPDRAGESAWGRLFFHEHWPRQFRHESTGEVWSPVSALRERFQYWLETGL